MLFFMIRDVLNEDARLCAMMAFQSYQNHESSACRLLRNNVKLTHKKYKRSFSLKEPGLVVPFRLSG